MYFCISIYYRKKSTSLTMTNIEDYRRFCLSLGDDVEEKMPFKAFHNASNVLVFYINGHMFSIVTLKCQPERIIELRER